MIAILGKIKQIENQSKNLTDGTSADTKIESPQVALSIQVEPTCILPRRTAIPEWLKDQSVQITRTVADIRELGGVNDSIVLTPSESAPFLAPLVVEPALSYGTLPTQFQLQLRWWKDEKPPVVEVQANSRRVRLEWTKAENGYSAVLETSPFFDIPPTLPVQFTVTCDKFKAIAVVLPNAKNYFYPVPDGRSERYQSENPWFQVRIAPDFFSAGVVALTEKARAVNYFAASAQRIYIPLQGAGHTDVVWSGWNSSEPQVEAALTVAGSRREGDAARLSLGGQIEDNLHTTVSYTLLDSLPVLLIQRDYQFEKGDDKDKDKEKNKKPAEPIDDLKPIKIGFRASVKSETLGMSRVGVLTHDGEHLVALRTAETHDHFEEHYWRMADGWSLIEDHEHHNCLLYLFDRQDAPHLSFYQWANSVTFEANWNRRPIRPPQSVGYTIALAAGGICGANDTGAWIACRTEDKKTEGTDDTESNFDIAVIARLREVPPATDAVVRFSVGGKTHTFPLERISLPGVGTVLSAVVTVPAKIEGDTAPSFETMDLTVAGIPRRYFA